MKKKRVIGFDIGDKTLKNIKTQKVVTLMLHGSKKIIKHKWFLQTVYYIILNRTEAEDLFGI